MKIIIITLTLMVVIYGFCVTPATKSRHKPVNVIFTEDGDQGSREGLLIYIKSPGIFESDSGQILSSNENLEVFLRSIQDTFAPRLIISSSNPKVEYYHSAMNALLLFKKHCVQYSCVIENDANE